MLDIEGTIVVAVERVQEEDDEFRE